ncbi:hypothetical protein [Biostraticola tofi]|uniref:Uncharacterized protein n=1 Tax=Biostraticola tofi TaxID=466109 RepID=A0A4R3YHU2_9GAMM|nr:hypothetical protein [Biostraticola tofi]TCV91907.1 hypothetical protein EDC52_11412 [Biostraticola tofi]
MSFLMKEINQTNSEIKSSRIIKTQALSLAENILNGNPGIKPHDNARWQKIIG